MPFVYILKSLGFSKTYTGSTDRSLEIRLSEHNLGYSPFTSKFKPWKLIYFEEYKELAEARKREKYLKTATGRRFIKKNNIVRE
jgi:putative endonuclease